MARSLLRSTPARATCITARDRHPLFPARAKAPVRLRSSSRAVRSLQQRRGPQQPAAASGAPPLDEAGQQDGPPEEFTLILYTKPDCPLCEGLQQKLEAVIDRAQFVPSALSYARVEVRNIQTSPAWEAAYAMEVPVLAWAEADGSNEVVLPRPAPRLGAEGLQRHLEKVLARLSEGGS